MSQRGWIILLLLIIALLLFSFRCDGSSEAKQNQVVPLRTQVAQLKLRVKKLEARDDTQEMTIARICLQLPIC